MQNTDKARRHAMKSVPSAIDIPLLEISGITSIQYSSKLSYNLYETTSEYAE